MRLFRQRLQVSAALPSSARRGHPLIRILRHVALIGFVLRSFIGHSDLSNKLFVAMQYREDRCIAVLAFDDETFAKQLYPRLLDNIGRSMREIGDLDLSHLL